MTDIEALLNNLTKENLIGIILQILDHKEREGGKMANVFDVASYVLEQKGNLTTVKLQKLIYYCQAWSLVWSEDALFDEEFQAWANGPVVPALFSAHKGKFRVVQSDFPQGNPQNLSSEQKETIDRVLEHYGDKPSQWLVDLTHLEDPWREARGQCGCGEPCSHTITLDAMMEYYSGL